ncbi:MAG TPA: hypothetical protein VII95_13525 [Terriglobales bacterium]|jgi:hypothetical protein
MTDKAKILTYYFGVLCGECHKFIYLDHYQTLDPAGIVDVELGIAIRCKHPPCTHAQVYYKRDVVYSRERDKMVPLGRDKY